MGMMVAQELYGPNSLAKPWSPLMKTANDFFFQEKKNYGNV